MPLLHRRGNGASRFQAVLPLRTLRHGPSAFAFHHLSTPPVISSRRYLNTFHIRTMPVPFSTAATTDTETAVDGEVASVIPPPRIRYADVISREVGKGGGRKKRGRDGCIVRELIDGA